MTIKPMLYQKHAPTLDSRGRCDAFSHTVHCLKIETLWLSQSCSVKQSQRLGLAGKVQIGGEMMSVGRPIMHTPLSTNTHTHTQCCTFSKGNTDHVKMLSIRMLCGVFFACNYSNELPPQP